MKDPGQGAIREEETKRCELRNTVGERWRLCHGAMTMYGTSLLGYRSKRVRCKACLLYTSDAADDLYTV